MYIKISVNNKIATLQDNCLIINGNSDYVIKFDFDSEWDAYETKTARFVTARGHTDVVFSGDEVALPVITDAISVRVGVYAGNLHTTTPAVIFCRRCITDGSGSPVEPTPDVYSQLMERLNNLDGATPATAEKLGVVKIGDNLKITEDGVLSVDTADAVAQDNTRPITSAAVYTAKSNIEALLGNLSELETEAKNNLVAAINEAAQSGGGGGSGLTAAQINALDGMFKVCAFTKADISAEYNAFCTAFGIEAAIITGISATYSGGDVAVGTAVTDLTGIVVTAHYSDGTSKAVTGYTLDGTIAEGENTISVTYNGKTATFTVTGTVEHERVEHIVSGQTFPVTLTFSPVEFDVTPALARYEANGPAIYYDVEIDVESISSENAYVSVAIGSGAFVRNASDYAGQTGTLNMTGEVWHPTMSDASQIRISCNKGTETSNQTAVITGVRIYER